MIIGYGVTLTFAVGLLIAYFTIVKKKEFWLCFLFACVVVVNLGYFLLSISKTLKSAIFANNLAYLGSIFLMMSMLFTVVELCGYNVKKKDVITCVSVGVCMFLIVATTGIFPWFYKSVAIVNVGGATKIVKELGFLSNVYILYISSYFINMVATIIYSIVKKKDAAQRFASVIAGIVLINLFVWCIERFGKWDFEFLSVSYIFSEMLFVLLYWMEEDYVQKSKVARLESQQKSKQAQENAEAVATTQTESNLTKILQLIQEPLSAREREILEFILKNKKRKDIATELMLSENTIKTYTRALYAKLGVASRSELYDMLLKD